MTKLIPIILALACFLNGCPDAAGEDRPSVMITCSLSPPQFPWHEFVYWDSPVEVTFETWPLAPRMRYDTIFVDTTRYYAKVDTCLTCPLGWEMTDWCKTKKMCWRDVGEDAINILHPKWCVDTTWLPKVQVWLTEEEYKKLMEWLSE